LFTIGPDYKRTKRKIFHRNQKMEIATVLNAHSDIDLIRDAIDAISFHVTKNIIVVFDGAVWPKFKNEPIQAGKIEGFYHNVPKSPYRNVALGLQTLYDSFPNADWYCYTEADVLFGSDRFKHNLKMAEENGIWMLGNDGHVAKEALVLIQAMLEEPLKSSYYLLGCYMFFHKNFMKKLKEINFFERFLNMTNAFSEGFFPFYGGYDLSEHLYPTLCRHFGGNVGVFAHYDETGKWHGAHEYFPARWRPELDPETENFPNASIMHPLKSYDHPIRALHRERRKLWKTSKEKASQLDLSSTSQIDTPVVAGV